MIKDNRGEPAGGRQAALVTGAARRIGRAIAIELARQGYLVALHYRSSRADAEALAHEIRSEGGVAEPIACDLADVEATCDLVARAEAALGPVTVLVNNASEFRHDALPDMRADTFRTHLDVNLQAPIFLAQAMAGRLPAASTGNVVNLIDQRVLSPTPEFFSYSLAKAALWTATRMMAQALAPRVRVNAIGPGPTLASIHQTAADFEAEKTGTLLRRGTTPAEIAAAVRFILDAPSLTGQMLVLDGGQHLAWTAAPASLAREE